MYAPTCSAIWFRTSKYGFDITEVTVLRSTEKSVWMPCKRWRKTEERADRHSGYFDFWPSRAEAVEHLRKKAEKKIDAAERTISECREFLSQNGGADRPDEGGQTK